jgi:hypothetical protein
MQPSDTPPRPAAALQTRVCRALALALVAYFLASIARFYHPGTGFTALIGFGGSHDPEYEVSAAATAPHLHIPEGGYDGQFYAQLALAPLLRDPTIDRALDAPPYRARRIFFSWTAYLAGLGRPAWILQAYALQNVVCWLLFAGMLLRWVPPDSWERLAVWGACLFGQGMLASVRLALSDGPSMLLLAGAAATAEQGRLWATSMILGVSGLARETNLLGLTVLSCPRTLRDAARALAVIVVAFLPLLLWQDYLYSIYRGMAFVNQNQLGLPFTGFVRKWDVVVRDVMGGGIDGPHMLALLTTTGLTVQAAFLLSRAWSQRQSVWLRLSLPFLVLMFCISFGVWGGYPGAAARVVLPMTVAFNILLAQSRSRVFWLWYAAGNAALVYAPVLLRPA